MKRNFSRPRVTRTNRAQTSQPQQANRDRDTARWIVGLHSCAEALKVRPKKIREVWFKEGWSNSKPLSDLQEIVLKYKISIREKSMGQLETIGSGHQGIALACLETPAVDHEELKSSENSLVLLLDNIEDPHNLGSILRTSWLIGVKAVFIPKDRAVGLTPSVCKVASGGAEHVPVEVIANLGSLIEDLKSKGFWIYGLAEAGSKYPWDFKLGKKIAWVIGNEAGGMRKATERACDELVRLPQVVGGSSYNAAIASAMALTETFRQMSLPSS